MVNDQLANVQIGECTLYFIWPSNQCSFDKCVDANRLGIPHIHICTFIN